MAQRLLVISGLLAASTLHRGSPGLPASGGKKKKTGLRKVDKPLPRVYCPASQHPCPTCHTAVRLIGTASWGKAPALSLFSLRYPIQNPREACYGDMDGYPGVRNYGVVGPEDLYDVYCYAEDLNGDCK